MERRGYRRSEVAPGVTEHVRDVPHVTYLTDTPQVHIHYRTDDATMDEQGYGEAELACHGCATALVVRYAALPPSAAIPVEGLDSLRAVRDTFQSQHRACVALGPTFLCPPERRTVSMVDLRDTAQRPGGEKLKRPRRPLREWWHRIRRGHWPEWWMFVDGPGCGICHPESTR